MNDQVLYRSFRPRHTEKSFEHAETKENKGKQASLIPVIDIDNAKFTLYGLNLF